MEPQVDDLLVYAGVRRVRVRATVVMELWATPDGRLDLVEGVAGELVDTLTYKVGMAADFEEGDTVVCVAAQQAPERAVVMESVSVEDLGAADLVMVWRDARSVQNERP